MATQLYEPFLQQIIPLIERFVDTFEDLFAKALKEIADAPDFITKQEKKTRLIQLLRTLQFQLSRLSDQLDCTAEYELHREISFLEGLSMSELLTHNEEGLHALFLQKSYRNSFTMEPDDTKETHEM